MTQNQGLQHLKFDPSPKLLKARFFEPKYLGTIVGGDVNEFLAI